MWSGLFYYHIRNVATYSFIFSFSYCKLTEFKILSLYNLDSTIISNLGISSIVSTHLWIFLLHLIGNYSYHYFTLGIISIQFSSSSPKSMSPWTRLLSQLLFWAIELKVMAPLATLSGFLPHYEISSTMLRFPSWLNVKRSYL